MDGSDRSVDGPTDRGRPAVTQVRLRHFSRAIPMLLLRSREAVMRHFRIPLRRFGITEQQWRVLRALHDVSEIEVTDLAKATFLLAPSLSRILRDLERRGLVQRRPDQADQRRSLVRITTKGMALIDAVTPGAERIYREITARFGPQRLAALQELLLDLESTMNESLITGIEAVDDPAGT